MASFLRPKRGKKKTATDKLTGTNVLVAGELFMEVPEKGVGKGPGKIKMGDGISDYEDLPYFIDPEQATNESPIEFTEASGTDGSTACTYDIKTKSSVSTLMTKIAGAIRNFNTRLVLAEERIDNIGSEYDFLRIEDSFNGISLVANEWKNIYDLPIRSGSKVLVICNIAFGHRSGVNQDLTTRQTIITVNSVPVETTFKPDTCWTSCAASSGDYTVCNSVLYIPDDIVADTIHVFAKHTASGANIYVNGGIQVIYL